MSDESEDRDRMIGNALSLILSASRGNHIVHDACLEVDAEITRLRSEKNKLQELAIWMTGCGYDFCQHEYFVKSRHLLSAQ